MADLTIVVEVENNQTFSRFSVPPSGKLVYRNGATAGDLLIAPKSPTTELPFCESNGKDEKPVLPIGPGEEDTFHICDGDTDNFYYTAKIGQAYIEDPIVIIEKKQNYALDPWMAGIFGALIGAAIAYLSIKSRAKQDPPAARLST
jgi:hypothetical protein